MERSSPLAAMGPPPLPGRWGPRHELSDFLRLTSYDATNFNFRDLSMGRLTSNYFAFKPARGSSPTSSLAVDMSQNFYIDQSPQLPTPRRSLFTSANIYDRHMRDAITPPIPSSSPGPECDSMDISPLPHKYPYSVAQIDGCSLVRETIPIDDARPILAPVHTFKVPPKVSPSRHERRISNPGRPYCRRNLSMSAVPAEPISRESSMSLFQFGPGVNRVPPPLLESFAESPPSERKPASTIPVFPLAGFSRPPPPPLFMLNGSPVSNGIRRNSGPRPSRFGGRRTQSVQYNQSNPFKTCRQEKRSCTTGNMQPASEVDTYKLKLPYFRSENDPDSLPRITKETLVDVLEGAYGSDCDDPTVIDCRFEYEFQGGHIDCARNFNDKELLANQLFARPSRFSKLLIFHCEYSAHRAPLMAKFIRQRDRAHNQEQYPKLSFPEMYILDGGYSAFFKSYSARCFPQSYVEMDAKEHEGACEVGMAKVKRRQKLNRAQTFAFGQSSSIAAAPSPLPCSLATSFTNLESMDLDFSSSPVDMPIKVSRRLDTY